MHVPFIDWCCFYYFVRNSLLALLQALCARIFSFRFVNIGFCLWKNKYIYIYVYTYICVYVCKVSNKAFLPPLWTRLLCLVVSIPLVCWLYIRTWMQYVRWAETRKDQEQKHRGGCHNKIDRNPPTGKVLLCGVCRNVDEHPPWNAKHIQTRHKETIKRHPSWCRETERARVFVWVLWCL